MRIVTGRASRLRSDNVLVVSRKTLVGQNASAIMAFVTERVIVVVLDIEIHLRQLTFEQGRIRRAVRPFRTCAARARPLIVVMAICAINQARCGVWREKARNIGVFSGCFHGMKRCVAAVKFQPRIRLHKLAGHIRRAARKAVGVTAITKLVFHRERFYDRPR